MAMNNVYYRFVHLAANPVYETLPARLRMNVIANPDFGFLVAESGAGYVVMHMQGTPRTMQIDPTYDDVVGEVADFFRQEYERALSCGIDAMAIAFDPGIREARSPRVRISARTCGRAPASCRGSS